MRRRRGNGGEEGEPSVVEPEQQDAAEAGAPGDPPPQSAEADAAEGGSVGGADEEAAASGLSPVEEPPGRQEIEELRRERDELRQQLLRRRAEFENYRRRVERDRDQAGSEAAAAIFRELIPTLDNLERALAAEGGEGTLRSGLELTYRELLAFLDRHGVTAHDTSGAAFDPRIQEALVHETVPGHAEGTVVEVLRKGYSHKDRLLRPALVKVAKGEAAAEPATEDPGGIH